MVAVGGLIRDDTGRWLGGFMHNIGVSTLIGAELWVVNSGLELAWEMRFRKLILEVDL